MRKFVVLYNPYSGNGKGEEYAKNLSTLIKEDLEYISMPTIKNFREFLSDNKDDIIICGGDGTLNYFINKTFNIKYSNNILYYSTGTGNDFYNEVARTDKPFLINKYLKNLPILKVNDKEYKYINGVGLGIDGYCCEIKNLKRQTDKVPSYTAIALKALFTYKPKSATIMVDKRKYKFNDVWLVSVMNGKYYGGGMKVAPNQNRLNANRCQTVILYHSKSKLKTLLLFPKIFKGEHIKNKNVEVFKGNNIKVEFNEPCALQIDGDVIVNVYKYEVKCYNYEK